jgi:hypothetical protein
MLVAVKVSKSPFTEVQFTVNPQPTVAPATPSTAPFAGFN